MLQKVKSTPRCNYKNSTFYEAPISITLKALLPGGFFEKTLRGTVGVHTFGETSSQHSNATPSNWDQAALDVRVMLYFDKVFHLEDILLSVYSTSTKYQ